MNFAWVRRSLCAVVGFTAVTASVASAQGDILSQLIEKGTVRVNTHDRAYAPAPLAGLDSDPTKMAIKSNEIKDIGAELILTSLAKDEQRQGIFIEETRIALPGVVALSGHFGEKLASASLLVGTFKSTRDERAVVLLRVVSDEIPEGTTTVVATADDLGAAHLLADAVLDVDAADAEWVAAGGNGLRAAAANHPCFDCPTIRPKNPAPGGGPKPNGCTNVPDDAPGVFNFTACCNDHDMCYSSCTSTRSGCDKAFRSCMMAHCKEHDHRHHHLKGSCRDAARIYYWGVRIFGGSFYCDAQRMFCECVAEH